jgi:uncharacterized protein
MRSENRTVIGMLLFLLLSLPAFVPAASADAPVADALQRQDTEVFLSLLQQRADVTVAQPDGTTALHWAAHWANEDAAGRLIAAGAKAEVANDFGVTPLSLACVNGHAPIVELLLRAGASPHTALASGETPVMVCARAGSAPAVTALIAAGADVNSSRQHGARPR